MAYPVPHIVTELAGVTLSSGNFLPLAQTVYHTATSTEAYVQMYMTQAGTWSGLSVYFRVANASGSSTFTVRKNGVDTALTVTVSTNSTGLFQDLTDSVTVAVGDLMSIGFTTSAGTATGVPSITTLFTADSGDSVQYNMALDPGGYSNGTQPRYFRIAGDLVGAPTVEASNQAWMQHDGEITSMGTYISSNSRTTTTTFRTRINGSNGTVTFGVPASPSGTGFFIDTAHSDAFVATDLINGIYTWASGANGLIVRNIQYTLVSTNPRELTIISGNTLAKNSSTGTGWGFTAGYTMTSGATESIGRSYPITPGVMSGLAYYVSANTATQTLTFLGRKNGANATLTVAFATGVLGWQQDTTHTDTYDNNDYSTMGMTRAGAGSGSTTMQSTSVLYLMDEIITFKPIVMMF